MADCSNRSILIENYIVICDYLSRYFEIERLPNITTAAVIHKMKAVFARHGIPKKVVSDNGPCYNSCEFQQFAESWGFQRVTSSYHYPQSNGLAEKTVQTAKRILTKAKEDKKDPYLSLLEYRNTPVDGLKSPAQILMSCRLRSILLTTALQLRPQVDPQDTVQARREICQWRQKQRYDRSTRPLPALHAGVPIRFQQENGRWKPATSSNLQRLHKAIKSKPAKDKPSGETADTFLTPKTTSRHPTYSSRRSVKTI